MVIKLCVQNTLQLIVPKYFIHIAKQKGKTGRILGTNADWGLKNVTFESRHEVKDNRPIEIHGGCFVLFSSLLFFSFSAISTLFLFLILILKGRENKKQRTFTCCFT